MSHLQSAIEESVATLRSLAALEEPLNRAAQLLTRCLTSGRKLLVCGNGARNIVRNWGAKRLFRGKLGGGTGANRRQLGPKVCGLDNIGHNVRAMTSPRVTLGVGKKGETLWKS